MDMPGRPGSPIFSSSPSLPNPGAPAFLTLVPVVKRGLHFSKLLTLGDQLHGDTGPHSPQGDSPGQAGGDRLRSAARMAGHTEALGLSAGTSGIPARPPPEKIFPFRSMFCSKLLLKEIYSLKLKKKSTVK